MLETGVQPKAAYEPEGQAIAIYQAQRDDELISNFAMVLGKRRYKEEDLSWINIPGVGSFLEEDCYPGIKHLKINQLVLKIHTNISRPDICFGREDHVIAAIFTKDNKLVYKSPGFDLDLYVWNKQQKFSVSWD